jgi:ATP-dependent DNA helicase RecQ
LAKKLKLPFITVLERTGQAEEQKLMQNSTMQARNVYRTLEVKGKILDQPLLLIDDIIDSGWTLTMAGYILRKKGSGLVYPFTLANAAAKKG